MLNEYSFDNIYIRHAIDEQPDSRDFSMHIHDQCEIYFLVSGNVGYLVEGSEYTPDENCIMIMRPAEAHTPKIIGDEKYERYAINFPLDFAKGIDPEGRLMKAFTERSLGQGNMLGSNITDVQLIHKLFSEMCAVADDYDRRLTIRTHLLMLLDIIGKAYLRKNETSGEPRTVRERIVMYVNRHLFEDISVPKLAEHFFLSPSQFSRIFRQATGAAPWEYITKKRLTAAKEKIHSGSSAQSASESCGFKDYSVFYRAYVKHFGCAPTCSNDKTAGSNEL